MDVQEINVLVLAYLGDSVYEQYFRQYFICQGISNIKKLQETVIPFVRATGQAFYLRKLMEENFFTEEELAVIRRSRNAKNHAHPKSCDVLTYKHSTALEAVIGYLSLLHYDDRIQKILSHILEVSKC